MASKRGSKENDCPGGAVKRKCLSLRWKLKVLQERFPLLPVDQVEDSKKPLIPKNTEKSTQ